MTNFFLGEDCIFVCSIVLHLPVVAMELHIIGTPLTRSFLRRMTGEMFEVKERKREQSQKNVYSDYFRIFDLL